MDIDAFDAAFADVETVASIATVKTSVAAFVDPANLALFKRRPRPAIYIGVEVGSEGLEREAPPLDETLIFGKGGCGALRGALATGGVDDDNPRWHLKLMAASFLPSASVVAHAMGNKHHQYTPAGTDAEMARIAKDKTSRVKGMGWPGCAAFEQAGCKECALCPHRGKIRSPLNLGVVKRTLAPGEQPAQTHGLVTFAGNEILPGWAKFDLPEKFAYNAKGYVCAIIENKEETADGERRTELVPVLNEQYILDPHVQQGPDAIIFKVNGSVGEIREVMLERGIGQSSTNECLKRLAEQGVAPNDACRNRVGVFFMDLLRKIELHRLSTQARPFGWVKGKTGYESFVYGKTFHRDGTETNGGYLDNKMRHDYAPVGSLEQWKKVAKILIEDATWRKRMNFVVYLASAFAGPLMVFTPYPFGWLSQPGESGCGKSTVLKCAAAVWGHPEYSRLTYEPTLYSAASKMGTMAHITIWFDEMTEEPAMGNGLKVAMMDGSDRERMKSVGGRVVAAETKHWQTLFCSCGNRSAADFISMHQQDTTMGRNRIFELPWTDKDLTPRLDTADVGNLIMDLGFNYGQAGLVYAKFLASKSGELKQIVSDKIKDFNKKVGAQQSERVWVAICATLLLGAEFARDLDLVPTFDLPAMEACLIKCFAEQRAKLEASGQDGEQPAVETLTAFLKAHQQTTIVTDGLPERGGKTTGGMPFNILRQPPAHIQKGLHVQWVKRKNAPIIRISRKQLQEWLILNKHQPSAVFGRIKHRTTDKVVLGGRTHYAAGPERVMEMDILPNSWLAGVLADITGSPEDPPPAASVGEQAILDAAAIARAKDDAHGS